jgi:hypothetical protein
MPRILRELALGALFLALSVLYTWPLAIRLTTATSDLGDPLLNTWILDWVSRALIHHPFSLFQAPLFHPAKFPLAFSENMIGIAAFVMPFRLAGVPALAVHNLAMLLGFATSGYAASVLGRTLTRSSPSIGAGVIAGILYAFVPFRFDHLPQVQIVWSPWLPLLLAALVWWWRAPSAKRATVVALCLVMNGLGNIHWLLFGTTAAALTMLLLYLLIGDEKPRREWLALLLAFIAAGLALLPVLWPYHVVSKLYEMRRGPGEVMLSSAEWHDWLVAASRSRLYGWAVDPQLSSPERALFPGMMVLLLTIVGIGYQVSDIRAAKGDSGSDTPRDPRPDARDQIPDVPRNPAPGTRDPGPAPRHPILTTFAILLALLSWFGAVTPRFVIGGEGHRILSMESADVPFTLLLIVLLFLFRARLSARLRSSRIPVELWLCVGWIVIGVAGSFGLKAFFHHFLYKHVSPFQAIRTPARWAIVTYTGLAGSAAYGAAALQKRRWVTGALVVLALLDTLPLLRWQHAPATLPPVYAAIPAGPLLELPVETNDEYRYLGYAAEHHLTTMNGISGFEPPLHRRLRTALSLDDAEHAGCRYLVVHDDWLGDGVAATHSLLRSALAANRLHFVRRFDNGGVGGDWLFVLGAGPSAKDPDLERMLAGLPTRNSSSFGRLESAGPQTITGFALSPDGVVRVDVLLADGRVRIPAQFTPRPDIDAAHPWYPHPHPSGFTLSLPQPPPGVPRQTDLQIEIVDSRNRRTRLPDVFVQW